MALSEEGLVPFSFLGPPEIVDSFGNCISFVCAGVAFSLCMEQKHGPNIRLESLAGLDHQIAASLFCSPVNVCYIWFSCYTVHTPLLSAVSHSITGHSRLLIPRLFRFSVFFRGVSDKYYILGRISKSFSIMLSPNKNKVPN